ncbi:carbamoyltransferase [Marinobacter lutaoensis]|uniref:Carbamoyltransferase n=1 Tax=Marinobacter lutaoensis TaxID=135739 RepID=A0A1V2DXP9_9GAMM|nr:carbamoyltransferase C-terminal domain-containing protein [Marinobacter lutaoensis]ONF45432.1 carbamoyltransferase [Marinobacter lutaoensis]
MRVLGISPLDKDSTVAIVEDGNILFAAGEERFSRTKQQSGFPQQALEAGLAYTGLSLSDFDQVVYPFLDWRNEQALFTRNLEDERRFIRSFRAPDLTTQVREALTRVPDRSRPIHGLGHPNEVMDKGFLHSSYYSMAGAQRLASNNAALKGSRQWSDAATESLRHWQETLVTGLRALGWQAPVKRMEHHHSHAANAYLCSGFDQALCVTLDGYGSGLAGSVGEARNGRIRRLHGLAYPNSLGTLYEHVTSSLGFKPSRHEGKIVGLAAYGDPALLADILLSRVLELPGDFRIYEANNVYFSRYLASKFPKIDVAAAYQFVLEHLATGYIRHWVEQTGIDTVVLSGGVTANVKLNQRIFEIEGVRRIFIYPNMGDGGCGTGAALYHSWPGGIRPTISDAYFGPDYTEQAMAEALDAEGLARRKPEHLAREVARLIHQGKVVARFDGRMEYGPRALGNRSILYHAREPEVNQWLNKRLGRTEFMPFAPVTLYEARERCYHNIRGAEHAAEFMTITFDCTDAMREQCPAAVHVDGTARPQLIRREVNPGYYDILKEYEAISGIPSLINTSFNMHEEPIVNTPRDAVRAFLQGALDYLVLGPFLVEHPRPAS